MPRCGEQVGLQPLRFGESRSLRRKRPLWLHCFERNWAGKEVGRAKPRRSGERLCLQGVGRGSSNVVPHLTVLGRAG